LILKATGEIVYDDFYKSINSVGTLFHHTYVYSLVAFLEDFEQKYPGKDISEFHPMIYSDETIFGGDNESNENLLKSLCDTHRNAQQSNNQSFLEVLNNLHGTKILPWPKILAKYNFGSNLLGNKCRYVNDFIKKIAVILS
jgi:hypothetical protein